MTCDLFIQSVRRENENSTGAMTTAKNEILFDLQDENCYLVGELIFGGGNKNLVGGLRGGFFLDVAR